MIAVRMVQAGVQVGGTAGTGEWGVAKKATSLESVLIATLRKRSRMSLTGYIMYSRVPVRNEFFVILGYTPPRIPLAYSIQDSPWAALDVGGRNVKIR